MKPFLTYMNLEKTFLYILNDLDLLINKKNIKLD